MSNKKIIIIYSVVILLFTFYLILDTFVIERAVEKVDNSSIITTEQETGKVTTDENYYEDDNIKITITEYRENNTTIHVADVEIKESGYLKTALAKDTYGKNVTQATSTIANNVNAILAVNGDYYGVQEKGYVLKNGIIYRDVSSGREDLVIYEDGSFEIINEDEITLEELKEKKAYNILSFGPALIENGNISVEKSDEVAKAMASNPRTAIGLIEKNHYVFVVSDGRTSESEGLSLYELASFMKKNLNVSIAYNLDGGGSSTMYFNKTVINNSTSTGRSSERSVSDIVYIGY